LIFRKLHTMQTKPIRNVWTVQSPDPRPGMDQDQEIL
jgi:hypothetical protein